MLEIPLDGPLDKTRDPLNLDYRFLSLVLFLGTDAKLLEAYLAGKKEWPKLTELGLPPRLLEDASYLFNNRDTQKALRQLQLVTQTLVKLYDYCDDTCPSFLVLAQTAQLNSLQQHPLQPAGVED